MILLASSRNEGNTALIAGQIANRLDCEMVNLNECVINYYDYHNLYVGGDFMKIAEKLASPPFLIFATPVYWYAMSAQMKTFFDRLTDLTTARKSLGRKLAGKRTFLVATGSAEDLPEGFEAPFKLTSGYLEMNFSGTLYCPFKEDFVPYDDWHDRLDDFLKLVQCGKYDS